MTNWRKSSYSGGGNDDACVELAESGDRVLVRDSKDPDGGAAGVRAGGVRRAAGSGEARSARPLAFCACNPSYTSVLVDDEGRRIVDAVPGDCGSSGWNLSVARCTLDAQVRSSATHWARALMAERTGLARTWPAPTRPPPPRFGGEGPPLAGAGRGAMRGRESQMQVLDGSRRCRRWCRADASSVLTTPPDTGCSVCLPPSASPTSPSSPNCTVGASRRILKNSRS